MKNDHDLQPEIQERYFLQTFPLIEQITTLKLKPDERADREDISQDVKLSLLIWKGNRPNGELSQEEWLKFVNQVTTNKIKAFRRNRTKNTIPLSETDENEICLLAQERKQTNQLRGNTTMELHLLVSRMWAVIQTQSFFEHYALLLKNAELTSSLIYYRGCRIRELAEKLQLTQGEFDGIIEKLPLSDHEIAEFLAERFQLNATPAAIRKARQRATDELQAALKEQKPTKKNGKPSGHGKT